ncbi:MAG TPA: hypothetical protein PL072_00470 [Phycisphaerales bacterium]|nr:hypothetical protein [Phycisphaerales bacterium]
MRTGTPGVISPFTGTGSRSTMYKWSPYSSTLARWCGWTMSSSSSRCRLKIWPTRCTVSASPSPVMSIQQTPSPGLGRNASISDAEASSRSSTLSAL